MANDNDLVCPPQPKPALPEWEREWKERFERDERARQKADARAKAAYERRTRDYKISPSAAVGGNPYPEEE